jgi:hypothetical protein
MRCTVISKISSRVGLLFATVASLAATANYAAAVSVNIDFGLVDDHPDGSTTAVYTGAAAAPVTGTTWNGVIVTDNSAFVGNEGEFGFWTSTVNANGLLNSQGVATGVNVSAIGSPTNTGIFGVRDIGPNIGRIATNAVDLMRDYLIAFNEPQSVVLSGFTPGTIVDLYLYGAGDQTIRDTTFTVNGTHTATTTGIPQNESAPHTLIEGGDYVVLRGVPANGSGQFNILYTSGGGSGEAPFNGLQAVYYPNSVAGDTDGDADVDMADYENIRTNFRNSGATRTQGDLANASGVGFGDGVVDFHDFLQWQENFPTMGPSSASFVIPEPSAALLSLAAMLGLGARRRR